MSKSPKHFVLLKMSGQQSVLLRTDFPLLSTLKKCISHFAHEQEKKCIISEVY